MIEKGTNTKNGNLNTNSKTEDLLVTRVRAHSMNTDNQKSNGTQSSAGGGRQYNRINTNILEVHRCPDPRHSKQNSGDNLRMDNEYIQADLCIAAGSPDSMAAVYVGNPMLGSAYGVDSCSINIPTAELSSGARSLYKYIILIIAVKQIVVISIHKNILQIVQNQVLDQKH